MMERPAVRSKVVLLTTILSLGTPLLGFVFALAAAALWSAWSPLIALNPGLFVTLIVGGALLLTMIGFSLLCVGEKRQRAAASGQPLNGQFPLWVDILLGIPLFIVGATIAFVAVPLPLRVITALLPQDMFNLASLFTGVALLVAPFWLGRRYSGAMVGTHPHSLRARLVGAGSVVLMMAGFATFFAGLGLLLRGA